MDLIVAGPDKALWNGRQLRCAIGKNGIVEARQKREGDGKTPAGRWLMREILYRPDRLPPPETVFPIRALTPEDGWSENPASPDYNRLVKLGAAPEKIDRLWREDHLYDVIAVLGYNDDPVVAGKGSAIFLHLARPDFSPTIGCVGLPPEDLLAVLREADRETAVVVRC